MHRMQQDYEVAANVVVVFFCSNSYSYCLLDMCIMYICITKNRAMKHTYIIIYSRMER